MRLKEKKVEYMFIVLFLFCFPNKVFSDSICFEDMKFEKVICEKLNTQPPLTQLQILKLKSLKDFGGNICSLSGLENAVNLEQIVISDNKLQDITPLSNLRRLNKLGLWGNQISDISPLKYLVELRELYLNDNLIKDISPIAKLKNIKKLTLQRNPLSETSYNLIEEIKKNNPHIVIYHDRTLTPEKSLYIAQKALPIIVIIVLLLFLVIFSKKLYRKQGI
ncbi:MAG: leucine-rich repeat domain-containing protein [Anaerohalosphaeraceae bacterium]|nr:leucine-rich repeat domain-containing protein [Anaerohalosphaeraceae bacterium]